MSEYHYSAYGLILHFPFPCADFKPVETNGIPDVTVRFGEVPTSLDQAEYQTSFFEVNATQLLLKVPDVARFLVERGSIILIDPISDEPHDDILLYVIGSCLGALLQQRGILTLHASAIETEKGAVVFSGVSGIGKSTLLAAMLKRGYLMLSDDITAIAVNQTGRPIVLPALPRIKLREDAAKNLGHSINDLVPIHPEIPKYYIPTPDLMTAEPIPLHRIYILRRGRDAEISIKTLGPIAAIRPLMKNTYRRAYVDIPSLQARYFSLVSTIARQTQVSLIKRPQSSSSQVMQLAVQIEGDFTG